MILEYGLKTPNFIDIFRAKKCEFISHSKYLFLIIRVKQNCDLLFILGIMSASYHQYIITKHKHLFED